MSEDKAFNLEGLREELEERANDPEEVEEIKRKIKECSKLKPKRGLTQMDI